MSKHSTCFGLDFGTSNSVLAYQKDDAIRIADLDPSSDMPKTLKSVIFFDEEGGPSAVGQEAINLYLTYGGSYGRLMQSIKENLSHASFREACIFGRWLYVEEIIAILLREIKQRGELQVGHEIDSVVLGRPVVFSKEPEADQLAEKRLHDAAEKVGFKHIEFLYEPVAATLAYEATLPKGKEQLVLMGDFGGGTSDFVVMRLCGGRSWRGLAGKDSVLSVAGVPIGGDSFDSLIMRHKLWKYFGGGVHHKGMRGQVLDMPTSYIDSLCNWRIISQLNTPRTISGIREIKQTADNRQALQNLETLIVKNLGYMVFRSIELAKRTLSNQENSLISFEQDNLIIDEPLSRTDFLSIGSENLKRMDTCVSEALTGANISEKDIDLVLLTGGTSFVPAVRDIFMKRFNGEKILSLDAFTSVANGLGLYAKNL